MSNNINNIAYLQGISDYIRFKSDSVPKCYKDTPAEQHWRQGVKYAKKQHDNSTITKG